MDLALGFKTERRLAIGLLLMLFQALLIADALAGQCLKDTRPVKLRGSQNDSVEVVQLRRYLCETSNGDQVSVQFNRLNDLAASLLIHDKIPKTLRPIFANSEIVNNEILKEFKRLLNQFGTYNEYVSLITFDRTDIENQFDVSSLNVDSGNSVLLDSKLRVPVLVRHYPPPERDFPDHVALSMLENNKTVPNYNKIRDTLIWRYMTTEDLAQYRQMIDSYNRLVASKKYKKKYYYTLESNPKWIDPTIRLYQYLAKSGWPSDFIVITGLSRYDSRFKFHGDNKWKFEFYPRELVLDVAVIENITSRTIDIDSLIGNTSNNRALRRQELSSTLSQGQQHEMDGSLGSLAPGKKLIVPIRMTFVINHWLREMLIFEGPIYSLPTKLTKFSLTAGKWASIKMILHIFQYVSQPQWATYLHLMSSYKLIVPIRMTSVINHWLREMLIFEGPIDSLPMMTDYVWGPEMLVTGIKVNGEIATLEASAANYLALVASSDSGSCPYLYVWDNDARRWYNQGKIIHQAAGPAKEMAEVREFDGLVSRFQIIEQEAELAFINSAALELEFVDGSLKTVPLNHQAVKDTDNLYQELYFGDVLDLAFNPPGDIDPAKVKHSRLKVTGYYRRYGDILSERMTGPNRNDAPILRAVQR